MTNKPATTTQQAVSLAYQRTPVGLVFLRDQSRDEWQKAMEAFRLVGVRLMWWVSDLMFYGADHFGEDEMQKVAEKLGYSEDTIRGALWVARQFPPTQRIEAVPFNVHMALAGVKDEMQRFALLQQAHQEKWTVSTARKAVRSLKLSTLPATPDGLYRVLVAAPLWKGVEGYYVSPIPAMNATELAALPIKTLADDRAALFLWAPAQVLDGALSVMQSWGFDYKTSFVWAKDRQNVKDAFAQTAHEHLLLGVRGSGMDPAETFPTVFSFPVREHESHPDETFDMIESMYPTGPRIELFARHSRDGWEQWRGASAA